MFTAIVSLNYGKTIPEVPEGHPRVYINKADLHVLKKKVHTEKFRETWQYVKNYDHPFARVFEALITEDGKMAKKAAINFLPILKECTDARQPLNAMHLGACIYDWAYYQMSDSLKQAYIAEFKRIASSHEPYYPAKKGFGSIVGHNTEGWIMSDQLPAGVAIYDEDTVMYDAASAVFFEEFVPARNFVYQAHMHHQGDSYAAVRFLHDIFATLLFDKMGKKVFADQQQYVPYQLIYNYRPDGQQLRSGDTFDEAGNDGGGRSRGIHRKALILGMTGSLYKDPYQLDMFRRYTTYGLEKVFELIFLPENIEPKPISELPISKYFPHPMGEMIARTGWEMGVESNDAVIQMRIGNYFFGNHQTKDFGTFQIYYKGPLAIASGAYEGIGQPYGKEHWRNYHHQTISKNGLLIYDPSEEVYKNSANDGGQCWPNQGNDHPKNLEYLLDKENGYEMGKVTAHAIGPDPAKPNYSYISGDITAAYAPQKVEHVSRSMLTIHTENPDFPALFFVFDQVHSTNSEFKKTWLLHSIQEPTVAGRTTSIVRNAAEYSGKGNYHGKLICQTILPEQAKIEKIGGEDKAFWVAATQTNYHIEKENPASEEGRWRIEVSPVEEQKEDIFFHAMALTQAGNSTAFDFEKVASESLKGVRAKDHVVLFNPDIELRRQADFHLTDDAKGVFVAGFTYGHWEIIKDGQEIDNLLIEKTTNSMYLPNLKKGMYKLRMKQ